MGPVSQPAWNGPVVPRRERAVKPAVSPADVMMSLHDRVRRAIQRDALLPPGSRVVVAVSGGSDSVALLELLIDLAPDCGFTIAAVAHVNHGLRGDESDGDEAFCRAL